MSERISGKKFDKEMKRLHIELCALQDWVLKEKEDRRGLRRPRGPNAPDEVTFKHSVPALF